MSLFLLDALSKVMLTLISVIGLFVSLFSYRYMSADEGWGRFFSTLILLLITLSGLACANWIPLFFITWVISNLLLVQLMQHNRWWRAAREASWLTQKYFMCGFVCMALAFGILMYQNQTGFINELQFIPSWLTVGSLALLIITALIQSALWPFNRWLLSSLNSPTPVSAFMHAGLVNGGGFLIVRFAHLYSKVPGLLLLMFGIGIISAIAGIFYKLIQTDVKRMLACSTMAQMGFVFVQCGLGLFSAAVAHLCWHGVFKAYLFLSSSTIEYSSSRSKSSNTVLSFLFAVSIGLIGTYCFIVGHQISNYTSSESLLVIVAFVVSVQMVLAMLPITTWIDVAYVIVAACSVAWLYAKIDMSLEYILPDNLYAPFDLHVIHIVGLSVLVVSWLCMVFSKQLSKMPGLYNIFVRLYVWAARASLPHTTTMTLNREEYRYKEKVQS